MSKYVPPHLRPGHVKPAAAAAEAPVLKKRGIHFPSNMSGLRSHNERWHRFQVNGHAEGHQQTRSMKAMQQSHSLSRRKPLKSGKTRKSTLKGKRKTKRDTRSASPKRVRKQTRKVKSV